MKTVRIAEVLTDAARVVHRAPRRRTTYGSISTALRRRRADTMGVRDLCYTYYWLFGSVRHMMPQLSELTREEQVLAILFCAAMAGKAEAKRL